MAANVGKKVLKRFDPDHLEPLFSVEKRVKKALGDRNLRVVRRKATGECELWRISPRNGFPLLIGDWGPDEEAFCAVIINNSFDSWNMRRNDFRRYYDGLDEKRQALIIKNRINRIRESMERIAWETRKVADCQGSINVPLKLRPKVKEHPDGLGIGASEFFG